MLSQNASEIILIHLFELLGLMIRYAHDEVEYEANAFTARVLENIVANTVTSAPFSIPKNGFSPILKSKVVFLLTSIFRRNRAVASSVVDALCHKGLSPIFYLLKNSSKWDRANMQADQIGLFDKIKIKIKIKNNSITKKHRANQKQTLEQRASQAASRVFAFDFDQRR